MDAHGIRTQEELVRRPTCDEQPERARRCLMSLGQTKQILHSQNHSLDTNEYGLLPFREDSSRTVATSTCTILSHHTAHLPLRDPHSAIPSEVAVG